MDINSLRLPANTYGEKLAYKHSDQCCVILSDGGADCDCGAEEAIQDEINEEFGE